MALKVISDTDLANKGVVGQPDSPQLSALEMQQKVEEVVRAVAIPAINQHATQLTSTAGAGEIGANEVEGLSGATVQAILDAIGIALANKVDPETIDTINQSLSNIVNTLQMKVGSQQIKDIRINDDAMLEYTFDGTHYAVLSGDGTPSVAGKGVVEIPLGTDVPPEQRLSNGLYLKEVLHVGPGQEVSAELQDNTGKPFLLRADPGLSGAVPTSRTINGHALSSNVILTPADVGAVPNTRTINGHALSSNVTLTAADVGAAGQGIHGPYDLPLVAGVTGDARYWYTDTGLVLVAVSVAILNTDTYKAIASIPAGFRPVGYAYSIILQDTNADFPQPAARQLYIRPNGAELRTVSDDNTNQSYAGSIVYAVEV